MKKILITGASRGIGRAIAIAAAEAGYNITAHYNRDREAAESLEKEIIEKGGKVELIQFDVCDRDDCRKKLEKWTEENEPFGESSAMPVFLPTTLSPL